MGQVNNEPSMEDILASIKRIIAEDSEAVGVRSSRLRRESIEAVAGSPVLIKKRRDRDATEEPEQPEVDVVEEEAVAIQPEAEAAPTEAREDETTDILELTSPMPEVTPAETPAPVSVASGVSRGGDGLLSSPAAQASRNAFAALSQLQVRTEEGQPNTLEGLVADLLKPMLREWLDRELPALVERVVTAEVARLSGRA